MLAKPPKDLGNFIVPDGGDELRKQAREITESVEDVVAYPLLTEQVSFPPSPGSSPTTLVGPGPAGGGGLGQVAARAVSDVLGWKANAADPKGFVGSLAQAFTLTEVEGRVEATWNSRSYAVQTDLGGAITGAQASLFTRAKDALDQSLPLLDGLYPLDPDADPEYVKAVREMARSQMNEIVKELGTLGGPSVLRVNTYFDILLGQKDISFQNGFTRVEFDPDRIGGTLGTLRQVYGIYFAGNPFSNSVADEEDITNFRVISDYMTSLLQTWISNGRFFVLGAETPNFFGTQLVLLSRQYSVIAETINEVRFAFDSVFIGPAERQAMLLEFRDPNTFPPMFMEDLLREIENHATEEGPRLLQDGGRISVKNNIIPIVEKYRELVDRARRPTNLKRLPDGYRTIRVQRTLDDLRHQLHWLITQAVPVEQDVPAPLQKPELLILSVSPNPVELGDLASVTITGTNFGRRTVVKVTPTTGGNPISLSTKVINRNFIKAIPSGLNEGKYRVTVDDHDGTPPAIWDGTLRVIR